MKTPFLFPYNEIIEDDTLVCCKFPLQSNSSIMGVLEACRFSSDPLHSVYSTSDKQLLQQLALFLSNMIPLLSVPSEPLQNVDSNQKVIFSIISVTVYRSSTSQLFYHHVTLSHFHQ